MIWIHFNYTRETLEFAKKIGVMPEWGHIGLESGHIGFKWGHMRRLCMIFHNHLKTSGRRDYRNGYTDQFLT